MAYPTHKACSLLLASLLLTVLTQCRAPSISWSPGLSGKLGFDLNEINEEGLAGPKDGLVSVHYEYCIPNSPDYIAQVRGIDPTLRLQPGAPGRSGCRPEREVLCLGHTHQPGYEKVLYELASLPYIRKISRAWFE
ncbi:hypothetical protein [Phaeodactylibacter luteus]|uniref:Uncharacterized protein n=1 Tax=Phaeodactylibacter luteus TaxID=1564516 RepID=A0A5C6RQK5_9BACT|nr:hypothetical protein [Phaeodactylibacter luteus]TXB64457.1 hypothetical protein FRY97_07095 [Phaeodactylibacter luteus]